MHPLKYVGKLCMALLYISILLKWIVGQEQPRRGACCIDCYVQKSQKVLEFALQWARRIMN